MSKEFSQQTTLIAAFPGTGKSFYCLNQNSELIADSDSSTFNKKHFPKNYIEDIKEKILLNYEKVFISSHKKVRDELVKNKLNFILVYPNINLKQEYLERYFTRKSSESFIKLISDNWESWIEDLQNQQNCLHIELQAGQFIKDII